MARLNYHHLHYFWTVAHEGSVTAAAKLLGLERPTVTSQVRALENALEQPLFRRRGRRLVLTDFGQKVLVYADEIFTAGQRVCDLAGGITSGSREQFVVGLPDVMPKLIAFQLIQPALKQTPSLKLVCREAKLDDLLADLALHRLDIVLSDSPVSPTIDLRASSHILGSCGITIFGVSKLAAKYRRKFPSSLSGAPMLLPTERTATRRSLNQWIEKTNWRPDVVAEFDDSALLKVFGQSGLGLFPAPTAIEEDVKRQYSVQVVGRLDEVKEDFYAISLERQLKHPAILAILEGASENFG